MEQQIIDRYGALTPSRILAYFTGNSFFQIEHVMSPYTFIILGRGGPTGKTWLCNGLKKYGFKAFELSESTFDLIDYPDEKNHVIKNDIDRTIVVVLNKLYKSEGENS